MSGLYVAGVPPISVSPPECLFGCYCGDVCGLKLKYTTLCVLAESGGSIYFHWNFS